MPIEDLTELGQQVDAETIVVVTLGELRKAIDYDRLGKYVLAQLGARLEGEGLGYFPIDLIDNNAEPRQGQQVRIYRRGTGVGKLIQAVTNPSPGGDRELSKSSSADENEILEKVRALVCP